MGTPTSTPVYPIGVVKDLVDLTERQIRYYDKMGLVTPKRTPGGKRLYSARDVERLRLVKSFINRGMRVNEIKEELSRRDRGGDAAADRDRTHGAGMRVPGSAEAYTRLKSLYPVSDRAELERTLDKVRKD
ncbi:MAG TPA: MerR family transcriptional regulator [Firmicutes bacterium]|nr:MerR family transcriptional regulator [Bacillota bacterium]